MNLNDIRQEYMQKPFEIDQFKNNPIGLLKQWYQEAVDLNLDLVNALVLTTNGLDGFPNSRVVLLKEITDDGIILYTDYRSQKGQEIESNNKVNLNIFWKEQDRQIRIKGIATKINFEKSESYFQSRPKASQISATASIQSSPIELKQLEQKVTELDQKYKDSTLLPCPNTWGGYQISYNELEFWQGRPNRLHDRFQFIKKQNKWITNRLSP